MLDKNKIKKNAHQRRHRRVRSKVSGIATRPRLVVFRSLSHIYVQAIDDLAGKTIVAASDLKIGDAHKEINDLKGKAAAAYRVGQEIAKKLLEAKVDSVIFDKSGYKYHGRVKALAQGARDAGLKF